MHIIAIETRFELKRRVPTIFYPTKREAEQEVARLALHSASRYRVIDAEHEPGRSVSLGRPRQFAAGRNSL